MIEINFLPLSESADSGIAYYPAKNSRGAVVIFPGGGYFRLTVYGEGADIAEKYNEAGISAFVVKYHIKPCERMAMLSDAFDALAYVRSHADGYGFDKNKIAVCGFSAGAHLAMNLCAHVGAESRPAACVLGSAVTTLGDGTFPTMPGIFLGDGEHNADEIEKYSYGFCADKMPPTYIWYGEKDTAVDYYKNSCALAGAIEKSGGNVVLRAFADGTHGSGMNTPLCSAWLSESVEFLRGLGF